MLDWLYYLLSGILVCGMIVECVLVVVLMFRHKKE